MGFWVMIGASLNMTFSRSFYCRLHHKRRSPPSLTAFSSQLLINDFSPPGALGAVNGVAMTLAAATKAVAPAPLNAIFAFGVSHQIMRGYLAWVVLALLCAIGYFLTGMIPKKSRSEHHAAIQDMIE
jgi:hypothetical protein